MRAPRAAYIHCMFFLLSRIHNNRLRFALAVVIVLVVIVIDLLFSGHPALSIAILVVVVAVGAVVRLLTLRRVRARDSGAWR